MHVLGAKTIHDTWGIKSYDPMDEMMDCQLIDGHFVCLPMALLSALWLVSEFTYLIDKSIPPVSGNGIEHQIRPVCRDSEHMSKPSSSAGGVGTVYLSNESTATFVYNFCTSFLLSAPSFDALLIGSVYTLTPLSSFLLSTNCMSMSVAASKPKFGLMSHGRHNYEDSEEESRFASPSRITIQAEVHHQPFFEEEDAQSSSDIELVELKPNGSLPQTGVHPHTYKTNNYEQFYEESECQLVDFNLADKSSYHHLLPAKENYWNGVDSLDANSIGEHEALDSLDQVLGGEDAMSTSSYASSSMRSHSMISLSLSIQSDTDSTCSSQFSEATYRLGSSGVVDDKEEKTERRSISPVAREPSKVQKKREFIRRVERFGLDLQDPCLFPLALPMDGSDIYKGASTWESINLLADCVLSLWTDPSQGRALTSAPSEPFHGWHNPVLANSTKHLILQPEIADRFLLHPDVRLPFRRTVSEMDLSELGIEEVSLHARKMNLAPQLSHGPDAVLAASSKVALLRTETNKTMHASDEIENENEDRSRSRSSLTMYLAKKVTSFKEPKHRKDRFNLNLTKNMKTEAKRLASKNELENPYKFARRISKLEKRYYLSVTCKEIMSLIVNKGTSVHSSLEDMLEFGQELSQLIADLVCSEFTVDDQGQLIANAIETAFTLHQKCNYQSFKSVMRGLQLPEVYRLKKAWNVVQQKYPLHLRVFIYLTFLMAKKVDQTIMNSITPSLPTLASFLDILRVRCLSIWDQLEGTSHWSKGPAVVSILSECKIDEDVIEQKVKAKLMADMERKLHKWQQKSKKQPKFPLKRLIYPESKTMANVLRREERHARIGHDTINRLKASTLSVESNQIPITWSLRSLRHLPLQFQIPVIREFNSLYGQLIATIEDYKF